VNKKAFGLRGRHSHNPAFKTKVTLAVLREDKTMAELCKEFEAPHLNNGCKRQLLERAADVFALARRRSRSISRPCMPRQASWHWKTIF
jgi:transposase-like protein